MSLNECCTIITDYNIKTSGFYGIDQTEISYLNSEIKGERNIPSLESDHVEDKDLLPYMQNNFNEITSPIRIKRGDEKNHALLSKPLLFLIFTLKKNCYWYPKTKRIDQMLYHFMKTPRGLLFLDIHLNINKFQILCLM
jgi:hypothetical protein